MFYILRIYLRYFIANPRMKKVLFLWPLFLIALAAAASSADNETHFSNETNLSQKVADLMLFTNMEGVLYQNNEYASLFAVEIKDKKPCSPKDTVTVAYTISKSGYMIKEDVFTKEIGCSSHASTGEFVPEETGNYTLCGLIRNSTVNEHNFSNNAACADFEVVPPLSVSCDINITIKTNQTFFYENGQSLKFKPGINNQSFPFVIEYWIEDLFGNVVKNKVNTTNTNQKSWKTDIEEDDRVLFIKAVVHPSCNDANITNNAAEEMFVVLKKENSSFSSIQDKNSTINITEITPPTTHFGEIITADINIYKGTTDKYSLSAWVEKDGKAVSEKTKFHLKNKNTGYELALPMQIKPNCNAKIEGGIATLIVEGLGTSTKKELVIEGLGKDVCQKFTVYSEKRETEKSKEDKEIKKNVFTLLDLPAEIHPGEAVRAKIRAQSKEDAEYEVWGYLYRGNKCYSCASGERDENKVSFTVDENEEKTVEVLVKADEELEEGEYALMVKYKKDGQKTVKSTTQKMYVQKRIETKTANQTAPLLSSSSNPLPLFVSEKIQKKWLPGYEGMVVYESNSEQSKNMISYALLAAFGLLSLVLVISKRNT